LPTGGGHGGAAGVPDSLRGTDAGTVPVYFEAAVVIIALVFVGQVLELRARERTGDAIKALINLAPKTARRINDRRLGIRCAAGKYRGRRPDPRAARRGDRGGW
jgi:cation transport ATPase